MYMEGKIRYIEFIREVPPYFDGDLRFDAYIFLLDCCERLNKLGSVDSNGVNFTFLSYLG